MSSSAENTGEILDRLFAVVDERRGGDPSKSYTARLLEQGADRIAQKLGEEAIETVIAGARGDRTGLIGESADLLYHLLVLWAVSGVAPGDVWLELVQREGRSGLEEKRSRGG